MSSIIPEYNYDIFISYRQKDNKGDRWVSEFVEALKTELESTFKEEISVYFDINPSDYLLETYDVDASLKDKLKCLVFIPIISRTYCDPKSFAWEHEFKTFVDLASQDKFGLKVKLQNGNVASRVLPIRIHGLDSSDIKEFESVLGGVLRGIEFIYKEAGIDKPLAPGDSEKKNLNNTTYRIQVIKVAHAIKEIILGMKTEPIQQVSEKSSIQDSNEFVSEDSGKASLQKHPGITKRQILTGVITTIVLILMALGLFTRVLHLGKNKVVKDPDGRISIAVTVFDNNTNDTTLKWLTEGIPELIRNNLAGSKELSVQNSQTMYELYQSMGQAQKATIGPSLSREAAIKLKAGTYITGSFQVFGNNILTYIKLIDTKTDELLWTGSIEGVLGNYKHLADSLSGRLKDFLEIKSIKQKATEEYNDVNTNSPEALRKYVEGMQQMIDGNFKSAAQSFVESYNKDTTFTLAAMYASLVYGYDNNIALGVQWTKIAYRDIKRLPYYYQLWLESFRHCSVTKNVDSVLYCINLLSGADIKSRLFWYDIGYDYTVVEDYQKAVNAFEKVEKISSEWGGDWKYRGYYFNYGWSCHYVGLHEKEAKIYEKGLSCFPEDGNLIWAQVKCAVATGDTKRYEEVFSTLKSKWVQMGASLSNTEYWQGQLYEYSDLFDRAEEHYRNALRSEPNNYELMNNLALFLVHKKRNIEEADSLSKEVLKNRPNSLKALWVKGLVLYEKGKYNEALAILETAYDRVDAWYAPLFNDIRMVKKAVASQKNN